MLKFRSVLEAKDEEYSFKLLLMIMFNSKCNNNIYGYLLRQYFSWHVLRLWCKRKIQG